MNDNEGEEAIQVVPPVTNPAMESALATLAEVRSAMIALYEEERWANVGHHEDLTHHL